MKRKPLSPEAEQALQAVMRKFCEDMERGKVLTGVLAQLDEQQREA